MNGSWKILNIKKVPVKSSLIIVFFAISFVLTIKAQSTSQNFPTPITGNEINGKIPARDIGDSRLTSYFYTFNGNQGDVFINVVTTNLDGDIDIFTANNLKPLTKITVYSDVSQNETGRVIYLRKPEKLILRIEGRTPNDAPAVFRIKFAGSFAPAANIAENEIPETPSVKTENEGEVRVNSVGTIIETKPKPTPAPKETVAKNEPKSKKKETIAKNTEETEKVTPDENIAQTDIGEKNINVTVAENEPATENKLEKKTNEEKSKDLPENPNPEVIITDETGKQINVESAEVKEKNENNTIVTIEKSNEPAETAENAEESKETKTVKPRSLEDIRLIVLFTNGTKIERPMSQISRFGVDKGVLTIVTKEGKIGRYSILDVVKMTIE